MTQQRICTALLVGTVSVLWALSGTAPAVLADHGDCLGTDSCFEVHATPGCNELFCCTAVCHLPFQDFCCKVEWDAECVTAAWAVANKTVGKGCTLPETCCLTDDTCPDGSVPGIDADFDGVCDFADVCRATPIGTSVDSAGRPLGDLDGDCDTDLDDYRLFGSGFTGPL